MVLISRELKTFLMSSTDVRTRVLNQLSKADILKPLTDELKMSVNTIMFADELPENDILYLSAMV